MKLSRWSPLLFMLFVATSTSFPVRAENTDKAPNRSTPEEAYAAYQEAIRAGKWEQMYDSLTTASKKNLLFETVFAIAIQGRVGEAFVQKHMPDEKLRKSLPEDATPEQLHDAVFAAIDDPIAFLKAAAKQFPEIVGEGRTPLVRIKTRGDRAQGVIVVTLRSIRRDKCGVERDNSSQVDMPLYFQRIKGQWLLDVATADEEAALLRDNWEW